MKFTTFVLTGFFACAPLQLFAGEAPVANSEQGSWKLSPSFEGLERTRSVVNVAHRNPWGDGWIGIARGVELFSEASGDASLKSISATDFSLNFASEARHDGNSFAVGIEIGRIVYEKSATATPATHGFIAYHLGSELKAGPLRFWTGVGMRQNFFDLDKNVTYGGTSIQPFSVFPRLAFAIVF